MPSWASLTDVQKTGGVQVDACWIEAATARACWGHHRSWARERGMDGPLAPRGRRPADAVILDPWPPEFRGRKRLSFAASTLVAMCYRGPRK